ncbi:MAG: apolipoprotein N-acyltransferase [Deltaproteobacteria bacterium]|nr:apolipoprotein N-acyltransferase [Deltaproteobacteria bacterium]
MSESKPPPAQTPKPDAAPPPEPPPAVATTPLVASKAAARGLAVLSGVLLFLGFAGFDLWPCAVLAQGPILLAIRGRTPKQSFWLGWLAGTIGIGGGFYWIASMLQTFSGFSLPVSVLFASLLWASQGLQFALFYTGVSLTDRKGWPRLLAIPAVFAALEFIFPALFPWYYANSLHNVPALIQTADLGGVIFTGLLLTLSHAAIDVTLAHLVAKKTQRTIPEGARWRWPIIAATIAWFFSVIYGVYRIREVDQEDRTAPSLRVGVVQENLGLQEKRTDPRSALRRHIATTNRMLAQDVPLIVWSESALSYVFDSDLRNVHDSIRQWPTGTHILFGALREQDGRLYNTAYMADPAGVLQQPYDKTYLLAFGEYLPFGETFPALYRWSPNSGHFTAGAQPVSMQLPPASDGQRYRVAPLICYEDILPRYVHRFQRQTDSHLLAVILNDAWFGPTTEPWIHMALSKFRSIEHRRDFVRSANSGVSGFIDAAGRVIDHTQTFTVENKIATVHLRTRLTIYRRTGDWFAWASLIAAAAMIVRRRKTS